MSYRLFASCLVVCTVVAFYVSPLQAEEAKGTASASAKIETADAKKTKKKKVKMSRRDKRSLKVVEGWKERMGDIEHQILNGDSETALRNGAELAEEMVERIESGESGQILGALNMLRAFAAFNVGDTAQAVWHWQISLQMFPALADEDVSRFGGATDFLQQHPVRVLEERNPRAAPVEPVDPTAVRVIQPRKKYAPKPKYPRAKWNKERLVVKVNAIINEEGRPTEPVIVEANGEFSLVCATLEALWKWQYEPATQAGKPVPVNLSLETSFQAFY